MIWRLARVLRVRRHDEYNSKGPDCLPLEFRFGECTGSFVYNCGPIRRLPILAIYEGLGPISCNAAKDRNDFRPQGPAGIQREPSRPGCVDDGTSPVALQHQLHALPGCGHQDHRLRGCRVGAAVFLVQLHRRDSDPDSSHAPRHTILTAGPVQYFGLQLGSRRIMHIPEVLP